MRFINLETQAIKYLFYKMKAQEAGSTDSLVERKILKEIKQINCIKNSSAEILCANEQCTKFSFLCADQNCECHKEHPQCLKCIQSNLLKTLSSKILSYQDIENKIKTQTQKAIDRLSDLQQRLLAQCKQRYKENIGFNQHEKTFIASLETGDISQISGKTIWNMVLNHKLDTQTTYMVNTLRSDVNKIWDQFEKDLSKFQLQIKTILQYFAKKPQLFTGSTVLTDQYEEEIIKGFFQSQEQKIKTLKLLYRASEHNYSSQQFHNVCDGQTHTITVCETSYGKKIGGYTPLAWNSNREFYTDNTYKSFIFSLTNKDKLTLEPQSYEHIYCSQLYGPSFGDDRGQDLSIADDCFNNLKSNCRPSGKYKNKNYIKDTPESWQHFAGSRQYSKFNVKEYEVWKVQFV